LTCIAEEAVLREVIRLFAAAGLCAAPAWALAQAMPVVELTAGIHRIEAEVAATQENRMRGLMHRKSMPIQRGMLFVFDQDDQHCMWMRNTYLPLAVAFLDAQGRIINVAEMQPQTENNHCAARPARFALEMNAGWFRTRGLGPGMAISGIGGGAARR
jgi:uncharacterized membrane protein (UPF0127 family)